MDHQTTVVAAALTEAAKAINSPRSLDETLSSIVEAARVSVPGFDHVGISEVHRDGRIVTKAGTDPLVWELDRIQYRLNEGPCVDSIKQDPLVVVHDARHEQRWPGYIAQAVRLGLTAQLGVRLFTTEDQTLGGLNLYATSSKQVEDHAIDLAEMFGVHAAIALGHARRHEQLNQAVLTRQLVGQAIGIVMVRYQIDSDRAFQFLVRASSTGGIKLRDIAREMVEAENTRHAR
jgi:GAF domain-containing protein